MEFFDNIQDVKGAIARLVAEDGASLPEHTRENLITALAQPSPVVGIVQAGEALYEARGDLNNKGRRVAAQAIAFATSQGWHELDKDGRGVGIVAALRRANKEAAPAALQAWPSAADDPPELETMKAAPDNAVQGAADPAAAAAAAEEA